MVFYLLALSLSRCFRAAPRFFLNLRYSKNFLSLKKPPEQYHVPAALFTLTLFGEFHSMVNSANHHTFYVATMETIYLGKSFLL